MCVVSVSVTDKLATTNVQMRRLTLVKIEMLQNVNRYQLLKTKSMHV